MQDCKANHRRITINNHSVTLKSIEEARIIFHKTCKVNVIIMLEQWWVIIETKRLLKTWVIFLSILPNWQINKLNNQ